MTRDERRDKGGEEGAGGAEDQSGAGAMPKVDFSTFVLSLGTTALYQMGLVADPASGETVEADPLVAQQTVDTLEMLREKTRGNLDEEERKLIDSLLYELRMRFVEIKR
jgi:hypothetical protein